MNVDPNSSSLIEDLAWAEGAPVRLPVRWDRIQAEPGGPDWRALDPVVRSLRDSGHPVLAAVTGTPGWARDPSGPPNGLWLCEDPAVTGDAASVSAPPGSYANLAQFASELASRYGDALYGIEVWPEPNLLPNWSATGPDPEAYGDLVAQVADGVHAVAPETKVVSGGLAPTTDVGVCFLSDLVFLDRLARTGALAKVDAVGIEPFGLRSAPVESPDRERLNFRRAELAHQVLVNNGLGDLPLWAVAWGWNAGPAERSSPSGRGQEMGGSSWNRNEGQELGGSSGDRNEDQELSTSPWGSHPPGVAAQWIADAYGLARTWPWLEAAFLWHLGPRVPGSASNSATLAEHLDAAAGFALVGPSARPTRVGDAARALFAATPPTPPTLPAQPVSAPVRALLMVSMAALVCGLILVTSRTRLQRTARSVANRSRLPNVRAVAAAAAVGGFWVALGLMPAAAGWLGFVLAAALALVFAGRPELAPAACVLAAPFHAAVAVPFGPVRVGVLEAAVACAFAGWAISWIGSKKTAPVTVVDWLAVGLVIWGALAVTWSQFQGEALREWRVVLLEPALVFLMLRAAISRARSAEFALDGLVVGAALASLWGIAALAWSLLGNDVAGVVRAEGVLRIAGPYGSPNNLALFAGRAVSVAAATALFASARRRRAVHAGLLVVVLTAVGATFSRGALFIGLPAALLVLGAIAVMTRRADLRRPQEPGRDSATSHDPVRILRRAVAVAAVAAFAFLAAFARTDRIAGAFRPTVGGTLHLRLRLWESALRMGLDHPLLGVGPDNFLGHYRDTYVQRDAVQERFLSHPHNLVLDTWTRLGLVGLAAVVLIAVRGVLAGVRGLSRAGTPRALGSAALVALAYTGAHGLIDNFLFVPDLAVAWWVLVAAALAAEETEVSGPAV